jgi:hypothetical protein
MKEHLGSNSGLEVPPPSYLEARTSTVLIFLFVGPPIGYIALVTVALFPNYNNVGYGLIFNIDFSQILSGLGGTIAFSYLFGAIPALAVGAMVAAYGYFRSPPPIWISLLAGLSAFAIFMLVILANAGYSSPRLNQGIFAILATFLIPSLSCGLLCRRYWKGLIT